MTLRTTNRFGGGGEGHGSLPENPPLLLVGGATATIQRLLDKEMMIFVSGAGAAIRKHRITAGLGHLLNPRSGNSMASLLGTGLPIAADNDCFQGLDRQMYIAMLRRLAPHRERILWVTAPDIVADARATLARWQLWLPVLRYYSLRPAYVAQDGSEDLSPPWDELRCLFIGGSTAWKEGPHATRLILEAKARGKWVHVGRVNSARRERLIAWTGVDSIDGTQYSRFPDKYILPALRRLRWRQEALGDILL